MAEPIPATLTALRALGRSDASVEIVFSRDERDRSAALPSIDEAHIRRTLVPAYARAGLHVRAVESLDARGLRRYPTTWAQRLAAGRLRRVWRIVAVAREVAPG